MSLYKVIHGNCLEVMKGMGDNCVDTIISDPPYGLSFMGKKWDYDVPQKEIWQECLRVLKPGGTALIFAGSRTQHRMACNVEDAGFILKDCIMWLYGSGFPKATDISKQLDKNNGEADRLHRFTAEAKLWNGWKSHGLKPAYEIVICAEKPLDISGQQAIIVENLLKKEAQLWLLLSAQTVKKLTGMEKNEQKLASIAQWNVEKSISIKDDLLGQMDMYQLEETVKICLSIVTLWRESLVELYNTGSKSTIKTEIDKTIDWQTLNSLLLETTPLSIIKAEIKQPGSQLNVLPVAKIFNAAAKSINAIRELSVVESVMSNQPIKPLGVAGKILSPAYEPILVAMKPNDGTYANNALKWGVSGLNIEGGRIGESKRHPGNYIAKNAEYDTNTYSKYANEDKSKFNANKGRFPANIILDEEAGEMLGDPKRFFYCAKASKSERNKGCEELEEKEIRGGGGRANDGYDDNDLEQQRLKKVAAAYGAVKVKRQNSHPTVKPLKLMEYLCTLTKTPTGGIVLDPFMGSGTTGLACKNTGREFIGIELNKEYCEIAEKRIFNTQGSLF